MSWRFHNALDSFPAFSKDWDDINRQMGNHILLDSRFFGPLLRHFGSEKMLLAVRVDTREPGIELNEHRKREIWQTYQPRQEQIGAIH